MKAKAEREEGKSDRDTISGKRRQEEGLVEVIIRNEDSL